MSKMTSEEAEREREAFEAKNGACDLERYHTGYLSGMTQAGWLGWKQRAERALAAERVAEALDKCNKSQGTDADWEPVWTALSAWRKP